MFTLALKDALYDNLSYFLVRYIKYICVHAAGYFIEHAV